MYRTFSRPAYLSLALGTALIVAIIILAARNISLFLSLIATAEISYAEFFGFVRLFFVETLLAQSAFERVTMIASSLLIGTTIALGAFYARMFRAAPSIAGSVGIMGGISAFLGFGCAACGSIFFATLLTGSVGSLMLLLPYDGKEITLLGIALLAFASYSLSRAIAKPRSCPI